MGEGAASALWLEGDKSKEAHHTAVPAQGGDCQSDAGAREEAGAEDVRTCGRWQGRLS